MRLRNNIFAAAFDYLKREKGIKTQKRLAELMEVSEDTITRILKDRTEVTEDIITKLQTASGCIFNLQWLRGEDSNCMLAKDINKIDNPTPAPQAIDYSFLIEKAVEKATAYIKKAEQATATPASTPVDASSAINAAISAYVELTNRLKQEMADRLADKDTIIAEKQSRIAELERTVAAKEEIIKAREARIASLERQLASIHMSDLTNYPFAIGAAEDRKSPKI